MFEAGCVSITVMVMSGCVKKHTSHNYFIRITHNYLAEIVKFLAMLRFQKKQRSQNFHK